MAFELAVRCDTATSQSHLHAWVDQPFVREALRVSAEGLDPALAELAAHPGGPLTEAVSNTLERYFTRMTGRPTPFGLMACVGLGHLGKRTRIELAGLDQVRRKSRIDMFWLWRLIRLLLQDGDVLGRVRMFPNATLYRFRDRLRWVETTIKDNRPYRRLTSVDATRPSAPLSPARGTAPL